MDADALREAPLGSGPYKFGAFSLSQSYSFTSNPDYWRGGPKIKDITYRQIPDGSVHVMALKVGDADIINDVPISETKRLEDNPDIDAAAIPSTFTYFTQFNTYTNEALQDIRIHNALSLGVNVDIIIDTVYNDYSKLTLKSSQASPQNRLKHADFALRFRLF